MRTILIFIGFLGFLTSCSSQKETPYVVVFSLDGFRYNYNDSAEVPNLNELAKNGVKAQWMIPVYPTVTFPNHYAIATGLYPENSGITNNKFYNSRLGKEYDYRNSKNTSDSSFYKGVPLWNYLQDHSIKTAVCNWVGSDALINGKQANYKFINQSAPFKSRMDTVLHWLQLPEGIRPHFIMAYFPEPDHTGHSYGPFGKPTLKEVQSMDTLLGYFRNQLQKLDICKKINVIVLSDHGMAEVDSTHNIFIDKKIADQFTDRIEGGSQSVYVYVKKGKQDELLTYMKQFKHIKAIKRSDFPKNWHLNDTATVPNLVLLADEGYNIHPEGQKVFNVMMSKMMASSNNMNSTGHKAAKTGSHGYDNTIQSMQTIFYATGPAFKSSYTQKPFENVDVFPLICRIYKVEPPHMDGKIDDVEGMLALPVK